VKWFSGRSLSDEQYERVRRELLEQAPIPLIWLFGKTGSGKSSIVRYLTGAGEAEIGTGYRPQTRFSARYDFPSQSEPLLSFLDTRGLGEAGYDPREEIEQFSGETHLMIVVVRAMDHAVEEIVRSLQTIRKSAPTRPVLLALTALHDASPGEQHPVSDPFDESEHPLPEGIPDDLRRSLQQQYERFDGLFDRAVPIDLTLPEEGFDQPDFGGERLKRAVIDALPAAYRQTLLRLDRVNESLSDLSRRQALPVILASSTLAATAGAVPLPWVDIPVVMGIQSHLVYRLARMHHQPIDSATIAKVTGSLGGQIAIRMAVRQTLKFIPWVGMAVNAAAAFVYTYATGMAWNWYFTRVREGHLPSDAELREVFHEQLRQAAELWRTTREPEHRIT
jgi:uncharacterized protein (DUF697 family)/energy-coupling factor transporter ATP-binding protein EcfA2